MEIHAVDLPSAQGGALCRAQVGRNRRFYDAHGGPYYRFAVAKEQHNRLTELARSQGNAYYCAPRFHTRDELGRYFRASTIARHSVLLNPLKVGKIKDANRHNATFGPAGYPRWLHSEPRPFGEDTGGGEVLPETRVLQVDLVYVRGLSQRLIELTLETEFGRLLPRNLELRTPTSLAQFILSRVYQVSWLLLP